jgi:hypothetical protein
MRLLRLLVVLAYVPLAAAQSGAPPAFVAVEGASYHVPVFSNDYVTVLNVLIPSGRDSGYHRHALDSVGVLLSDTARTNQTLGAEPLARALQPRGTVSFTPYAGEPLVHTVTVQGEQPFHNIVVELLQRNPWRLAPGQRASGYEGGELVESVPGVPDRAMAPRAAEVYWQDAGTTRAVRNVGATRIELVELELK